MLHRLSSACLLACAALLSAAPLAGAAGATASAKAADKAAEKAKEIAALAAAMDALLPEKIECKAGTTAKVLDKEGKWMDATLTAVDLGGVHYAGKDGQPGLCTWFALETPSLADPLLKKALDPKNAGHQLLAARVMANLKAGRAMADAYLRQAAQLDKSVGGKVAAEANLALAMADYNKNKPAWAWPRLTADQEAEAVEALDQYVTANEKKAGLRFIKDQNNPFFVFYTDADMGTARVWAKKLMAAYALLCQTFNLDPHGNIWQGKCAVIVCKDQRSYAKWMAAIAPGNPMAAKSAGLSTSNTAFEGSATIQFYHDPGNLEYNEKVLVHELCHSFTAQFHGKRHLANWANEGLAEYACSKGTGFEDKSQESHAKIRRAGSMEDFFFARNISFSHYGSAFEITRLLLKKNPQGYAKFVKAVTEGMDAEEALKKHCGLDFAQLAALYARSLGMPGLKAR